MVLWTPRQYFILFSNIDLIEVCVFQVTSVVLLGGNGSSMYLEPLALSGNSDGLLYGKKFKSFMPVA